MKRILLVGNCGTGKSRLAQKLATKLNLPLIELDYYFHLPGWKEIDFDQFKDKVTEFCELPAWVMVGTFRRTLAQRCEVADTIIFLDFPRWLSLWGIFQRYIMSFFKKTDCKPGYEATLTWAFLKHAWEWQVPAEMKDLAEQHGIQVITLKNRKAVDTFLELVKK